MWKRLFAAAVVLVIGIVLLIGHPQIRARCFVTLRRWELEEAYLTGIYPANIGYQTYNLWDGEHPMLEFILSARGSTYYGCYYSPDDVPLPFQNVEMELTPSGQTGWTWQEEKGDNHGVTERITDNWYYFEASF